MDAGNKSCFVKVIVELPSWLAQTKVQFAGSFSILTDIALVFIEESKSISTDYIALCKK